jgi:hypothetical protein
MTLAPGSPDGGGGLREPKRLPLCIPPGAIPVYSTSGQQQQQQQRKNHRLASPLEIASWMLQHQMKGPPLMQSRALRMQRANA